MVVTETLKINVGPVPVEPVPIATDVLALEGTYDEYWQQFADISGAEGKREAERNEAREHALTSRLYEPAKPTGNGFVDSLPVSDVAEEWYLGLGSFNKLQGASSALMLAAGLLWENPTKPKELDPNLVTRFVSEVGSIRRGQIPERMQRALTDKDKLAHITLAGQALLDIARIPDKSHTDERIFAADLSFQVNHGLTESLLEQPELVPEQKRVLSDALKAKYDAKFEFLSLKKESGGLEGDDYEAACTQVLAEQVGDILRANGKITNGDLHEHYFVALMRYALNTWQGQNRYEVRAATRRQDAPHDGFAPKHLPRFSIDAWVSDTTGEEADRLVQLKTTQEVDVLPYAHGITKLEDVLMQDTSNTEMRKEMITGLSQMRGLIREVFTGQMYEGKDDVIRRHVSKVRHSLAL